jgi:hypothetical protein
MFNQKIEAGYSREDAIVSVAKAFDRTIRTIHNHIIGVCDNAKGDGMDE